MKYRPITDLSDNEVKQIVTEIFEPKKISKIIRRKRAKEIEVSIKTDWSFYDDDGKEKIYEDTEYVTLKDPFCVDGGIETDKNTYDFDSGKHSFLFKQFCLAKGVCYFLKNNPYLEAENAD